jgi:hypothetical protein
MTSVLLSPDMTPKEFQAWYDRLKAIDPKLSDNKLAKALDVDQPRIGKWRRGEIKIMGPLRLAFERLEQIMIAERDANLKPPPSPRRRRPTRTSQEPAE